MNTNPNHKTIVTTLMGGVAALAMAAPAFAAEDVAQPAKPAVEAEGEGNEIVVTATKREQTLQDVPVAVSVTTAATIERAQIRDIKDVATLIPSLRVSEHQNSFQTDFIIRGFGNGANNRGIEPSVGFFVDGVYRSRSAAQINDLPDIKRIEVLRGPQSTLFGKNASVGVVSLITAEPKFKFGGNVEATYGNKNAVTVKGVVTGPLSDTLAFSVAAGYNRRDGFVKDLVTGSNINDRNRWFVRGQLLYAPNDKLKVRLIADYSHINELCCAVVNIQASPATGVIKLLGGNVNDAATPFGQVVYNNFNSTNLVKDYGFSGQVDYDLGIFKLTSITAYRKNTALTNQDSDFSSLDILNLNTANASIRTFTQELRLASNMEGPLNFLAGIYYFNEKIRETNAASFGTGYRPFVNAGLVAKGLSLATVEGLLGTLSGNPALYAGKFYAANQGTVGDNRLNDNSISIFGQMDFKIASNLTLTGGLNYTRDSKTYAETNVSTDVISAIKLSNFQAGLTGFFQTPAGGSRSAPVAAATATALLGGLPQLLPPFFNVPNAVENGKNTDSNVSWTARLAYQANKHINLYVSVATGFKASSINLSRDSRPTPADLITIRSQNLGTPTLTSGTRLAGPEKTTVYEAGIKANWGIASANFTVFREEVRGFQSNLFTGTGFILSNAGKQSVTGFEFEGSVKPTDELTLSSALTYLRPKYDSYVQSPFGDASGVKPAGITPLSLTMGAVWNHPFANGDRIILGGDWHYEASVQILDGLPGFIAKDAAGNITSFQTGLDAARPFRRTVSEFNASMTYQMHNGIEVSVWGRNLSDNRYLTTIFDSVAQAGSVSGYPNQPRTFGMALRYKW